METIINFIDNNSFIFLMFWAYTLATFICICTYAWFRHPDNPKKYHVQINIASIIFGIVATAIIYGIRRLL